MLLQDSRKHLSTATVNVDSRALKHFLSILLVKMPALLGSPRKDAWPPFPHAHARLPTLPAATSRRCLHVLKSHASPGNFQPLWSSRPDGQSVGGPALCNFPRTTDVRQGRGWLDFITEEIDSVCLELRVRAVIFLQSHTLDAPALLKRSGSVVCPWMKARGGSFTFLPPDAGRGPTAQPDVPAPSSGRESSRCGGLPRTHTHTHTWPLRGEGHWRPGFHVATAMTALHPSRLPAPRHPPVSAVAGFVPLLLPAPRPVQGEGGGAMGKGEAPWVTSDVGRGKATGGPGEAGSPSGARPAEVAAKPRPACPGCCLFSQVREHIRRS